MRGGCRISWDQISIHTPTQGVTKCGWDSLSADDISIHTPTQGVTDPDFIYNMRRSISIHTPTQGVTNHLGALWKDSEFQSTLPHRE